MPSDKARWGRFDQLREVNVWTLRDILDEAAKPGGTTSAVERQVGDFYASCMDQKAIDAAGLKPIEADLARIASAQTKPDLLRVLGTLRASGLSTLFALGVGPDLKDSTKTLMNVDQGGTSLPDRDYYLKDDPKNAEVREQYVSHMTKMFTLAGATAEAAAADAKRVLALETKLADAQLDRVGRRNPKNRDNRMTAAAMEALAPSVDLKAYLASAEAPAFSDVNVGWPKFFQTLDATWTEASLDDVKAYARWRLLNAAAPALASPFERENFDFFSRKLRGIAEPPARWKTCSTAVDGNLGEALGQLYVEKAFGADSKARMKALVDALTVALEQDINAVDWMTPATRTRALENFGGIGAVIGHELTHGFDDSGRKFDGKGNLEDWWTEADAKAFEERAACVADRYAGYSPVDDPKTGKPAYLNGKLTLGENIGDNGGLRIAYMAMMSTLKDRSPVNGLTPEQRFFLGFAQVWCQNTTPAESMQRIMTDPHSPGKFRTNGTLSNMPEFAKAFSCKPGSPMAPENRCRVW